LLLPSSLALSSPAHIQEVPVLYSGGTRPPRWLITGTWKTEIHHSHTRMHSIYTRMHSIYTHSCRQNRQSRRAQKGFVTTVFTQTHTVFTHTHKTHTHTQYTHTQYTHTIHTHTIHTHTHTLTFTCKLAGLLCSN